MGLLRSAPLAFAACSGLLAGCTSGASTPQATVSPVAAVAPPPSGWQWTDAPGGPAVTLTSEVAPTASGARSASLRIACNARVPSVVVAWDVPVAAASSNLAYRFDGQPEQEMIARAADPQSAVVSDPLVVSRFIDEASDSRRLVVRAGVIEAVFATTDDGNLKRFRTECPSGTN